MLLPNLLRNTALLLVLARLGWAQAGRLPADSVAAREHRWLSEITGRAIAPRVGRVFGKAPAGYALYFVQVDTLRVPYLVYVPKSYNPAWPTPTLVYLHGGVVSLSAFEYKDPEFADEPIFHVAEHYGALVVFPYGRKTFGWVQQPAAFEYVRQALAAARECYHMDPRQLFLGGMSNGGTAAFWFASYHPDEFAGFYSFSALPKLAVGVINFQNFAKRPFYSLHALDDSLYRYRRVKAIYDLHRREATGWQLDTVARGGHGFIYGPAGEADMRRLLGKLLR